MSYQGDLSKLAEKFDDSELEWRCQAAGVKRDGSPWAQVVPYVQARAIYNRLDKVVNPENWSTTYRETNVGGEDGFVCGIGILIDGQWVFKHNGAGAGDFQPIKAGCSNALKRAAVEWGIGRYLYNFPKHFVTVNNGYPPKDGGNYVSIYQKADSQRNRPEVKGWAHAPSQNSDGGSALPSGQQGQQQSGQPDAGRKIINSKYGSEEKPIVCGFCQEYHIVAGDRITPTGNKTDKGKESWGAVACLEEKQNQGQGVGHADLVGDIHKIEQKLVGMNVPEAEIVTLRLQRIGTNDFGKAKKVALDSYRDYLLNEIKERSILALAEYRKARDSASR